MDSRTLGLARLLVDYSLDVRSGEWVVINAPISSEPLAVALVEAVTRVGAHASVHFTSESVSDARLRTGSVEQLGWQDPLVQEVAERADAFLSVLAPGNTRALSGADPGKLAARQRANRPFQESLNRRTASGEMRWTVTAYPTNGGAQEAGMSLHDYEDFLYSACLLPEEDPVRTWQSIGQQQKAIVDWMSTKSQIHVIGPDTDLHVDVSGRTWLLDDGRTNMPGGEIFTGPIENGTEGYVTFNVPAWYQGSLAEGVRLQFEKGVVVDVSASANETFVQSMLNLDEGARRLGEFAIGLNPGIVRPTGNPLFDEKMGGTIHMALGRSYPETGGTNRSALHWDMVLDLRPGGSLSADGIVFSQDGRLTVPGLM